MKNHLSDLPAIDTLLAMARDDPDSLEALRSKLSQELIDCAPTESRKRRLKGMQFVVNMQIRKAKTPLASCIKVSEMMWDSALDMKDQLGVLQHHLTGQTKK